MAKLLRWSLDRAMAGGLEEVAAGDVVDIEGSGPALATALYRDQVELAPLSSREPAPDATVTPGGPLAIPTGDALIGRTVDCLGSALDDGPPITRDQPRRVFERDPVIVRSNPGRLTLGMLVLDLQKVYPVGSSIVAVGAREILHQILHHQRAAGRVVVLACPSHAGLAPVFGAPRIGGVITVTVGESPTIAAQWLVPWTAMAIGAGLRARGRDVVVVVDPVEAWQFPVQRMADRGGWSTQLAQLASRAYADRHGSVSLLAHARAITVPLASSVDSVIDLNAAARGDLFSITKYVRPPIRVRSPRGLGSAGVMIAQLLELERGFPWADVHPGLDQATRRRIDDGRRIRECLRYRPGGTIDSLEQIASLLAVEHLKDMPPHAVGAFLDAYLAVLRRDHAARLAAIRVAKLLDDPDREVLLAVADAVAAPFVAS